MTRRRSRRELRRALDRIEDVRRGPQVVIEDGGRYYADGGEIDPSSTDVDPAVICHLEPNQTVTIDPDTLEVVDVEPFDPADDPESDDGTPCTEDVEDVDRDTDGTGNGNTEGNE